MTEETKKRTDYKPKTYADLRPPAGRRDALADGELGGVPVDPQGDENRDPPSEPTPPA
jgi:hypothetical protein